MGTPLTEFERALAIPRVSVGPRSSFSELTTEASGPALDSLYPQIYRPQGPSISLSPSLHDVTYYRRLCANGRNFVSDNSDIDILEIDEDGADWKYHMGDEDIKKYMQASTKQKRSQKLYLRAIFCGLSNERHEEATFGRQISLTQHTAEALLTHYDVTPQFLPLMLGEPHYWAPGDFLNFGKEGFLKQIEFFCQHPRWDIHTKQVPWSVYMSYDVPQECATYIIVCAPDSRPNETVKERLKVIFNKNDPQKGIPGIKKIREDVRDPFFLHALISHESFEESKEIIHGLRRQLYAQLNMVDSYAKNRDANVADRVALDTLTKELHKVSQNADSLLASAEMGIMITQCLQSSHERYVQKCLVDTRRQHVGMKIRDSNTFMLVSLEAQKRWLLSYKSRKDIAMNLVFNLVTQQDSHTNLQIAKDTKSDSSSMTTIAAVTMAFLPGTFVAGVFGMGFFQFDNNGQQAFIVSNRLWIYFAITGALTIITFSVWLTWDFIAVNKLRKEDIIPYLIRRVKSLGEKKRQRGEKKGVTATADGMV